MYTHMNPHTCVNSHHRNMNMYIDISCTDIQEKDKRGKRQPLVGNCFEYSKTKIDFKISVLMVMRMMNYEFWKITNLMGSLGYNSVPTMTK